MRYLGVSLTTSRTSKFGEQKLVDDILPKQTLENRQHTRHTSVRQSSGLAGTCGRTGLCQIDFTHAMAFVQKLYFNGETSVSFVY